MAELRWTRDEHDPHCLAVVSLPDGRDVPVRRLPDGRWIARSEAPVESWRPTLHGCERTVMRPEGAEWTLEELQSIVGGYIEVIRLPDERILIVNEEGRLRNLPPNPAASAAAGRLIVGVAIVADSMVLR